MMEFNDLCPRIFVVPIHVMYEDMVSEALQDLESGMNRFHAYVMPYMNLHGGTSLMADGLMYLSTFTVDNVKDIAWQTIGRFFRAHSSLYESTVLTLPLTGDFVSLFYREDIFSSRGMSVPRTLEEHVLTSQELNGTDLNGDGVPDFGSCFPWFGDHSSEFFLTWITHALQHRRTSQGAVLDTDTLTPLLDNPVVLEAIKLWKEVAGPPKDKDITMMEALQLWFTGQCGMMIGASFSQHCRDPSSMERLAPP